jgi:MFS family permease
MKEPITGVEPVPVAKVFPERATRIRYLVLGLACVLAVITYIQRLGFSVGSPEIKDSLHFGARHIGDLAAAFLIAYGLFQVPGGLLGDRFGGRHVLTLLVLGWSLLTGLVALTVLLPAQHEFEFLGWQQLVEVQFAYLLVARFLFGALQAGGFPVLGRIMADWMPLGERGFAQGTIWMISRLGGALVPFLFAGLFWLTGGWPIPFVLFAILGVVWCALFWPWFRNRPEDLASVNRGERDLIAAGRPAAPSAPRSVPWRRMAQSLSVWSLCLMYGCTGFSGNFFTSMLPTYLRGRQVPATLPEVSACTVGLAGTVGGQGPLLAASTLVPGRTGMSRTTLAWLSALPLAGGMVACILGGILSDWLIRRWGSRRWARRAVGMVGLALAGLAFFAVNWVEGTWLLGLVLTLTFFGNDLMMGPAWASCADIGERYAGTLSGSMNMIGAFAGAAGMSLAGRLLDRGQTVLVFSLFAGVYILASLCWLGVDATKRLADPA